MKVINDPKKEEAGAINEAEVGHIEHVKVEVVADGHKDCHRTDVEGAIGDNQREVEHHVSHKNKLALQVTLQFSFPSCLG